MKTKIFIYQEESDIPPDEEKYNAPQDEEKSGTPQGEDEYLRSDEQDNVPKPRGYHGRQVLI